MEIAGTLKPQSLTRVIWIDFTSIDLIVNQTCYTPKFEDSEFNVLNSVELRGFLPLNSQTETCLVGSLKKQHQFKMNFMEREEEVSIYIGKIQNDYKCYFVKSSFLNLEVQSESHEGFFQEDACLLIKINFLTKVFIHFLRLTRFIPHLIHCIGWQSALILGQIKKLYQNEAFFKNLKTMFSNIDLSEQGLFDASLFPLTGLPWSAFNMNELEFWGRFNLTKAGILFSDLILLSCEEECKSVIKEGSGMGLEGVFREKRQQLFARQNQSQWDHWTPDCAESVPHPYTPLTIHKKSLNKTDLLGDLDKPHSIPEHLPLVLMLGSFFEMLHKEQFFNVIESIPELDAHFLFVGEVDEKVLDSLLHAEQKHPEKISITNTCQFSFEKLFAAADVVLFAPEYFSVFPNQVIPLVYGSLPVLSRNNNFSSVLKEFDRRTLYGNCFLYNDQVPCSLFGSLISALNWISQEIKFKKWIQKKMIETLDYRNQSSMNYFYHLVHNKVNIVQ